MSSLASATFRKGYEWPFDAGRVSNHGSSLIDLLVSRERASGRRVFLDFTANPTGEGGLEPFSPDLLEPEARDYLTRSGALGDTPVARLEAMNAPAVQLFRDHDIDLARESVEISVCAQHSNGGLRTNLWWESNLRHLFPVGEVAGTHGVRRPGGAALNAGQVGGLRAAQFIARNYSEDPPPVESLSAVVSREVTECLSFCHRTLEPPGSEDSLTPAQVIAQIQDRMSKTGAHLRSRAGVVGAVEAAQRLMEELPTVLRVRDPRALKTAFWAADLCLTHRVYLDAMRAYLEAGGGSRGSVLVLDPEGELPAPTLEEGWRFREGSPGAGGKALSQGEILESQVVSQGDVQHRWVPIRPIPADDGWFERVWRAYREGKVVRSSIQRREDPCPNDPVHW